MRRSYWAEVHQRAIKEAMHTLSIDEGARGVIAITLAIGVVAALWLVGGSETAGHELLIRISATAVIALLFPVIFLWKFFSVPPKLHNEILDRVDEAESVISAIGDTEADRVFLSEMHKEGFRLYRAEIDPNDAVSIAHWKADMDTWTEKVKAHLSAKWSISALHEFDDMGSMGGFHYRRDDIGFEEPDSLKDERGWLIFCKYSAYLKSVDDIIRHGEHRHLGDVPGLLLRHQLRDREGAR